MTNEYAQGGGHWAGVARRKLEDMGAKYRGSPELACGFEFIPPRDDSALLFYFWDSVWTALVNPRPMIAFRATLQAYEYGARLGEGHRSATSDARLACRLRHEKWVDAQDGRLPCAS